MANLTGTDGGLRELALFAGAGGGILASHLLGHNIVCAVERDEFCIEVLCRRQNEGHIRVFPVWDDINSFNGKPWNGSVDLVSGGFPCQAFSSAARGRNIKEKEVKINVLELAIKPQDFFDNKRDERFDEVDLDKVKIEYFNWYPIILACSFVRKNKKDPFCFRIYYSSINYAILKILL